MRRQVLPQIEFYNKLSDSYDQMISWPTRLEAEASFFKKLVNEHKIKSSLDVACSTGFHVVMLRRMGVDAVGIDASPKMIEKARANSIACGVNVEYILGDMAHLSKRFSEGFDIVTCLGDTLPHVKAGDDVEQILTEIYKCMNPGGLFVLQLHNYDHIIKNRIRFMPPSGTRNGGDETLFFRVLDFRRKSIDYSVVKHRRHANKWQLTVHSTEIFPHYKKELEDLLQSVGLKKFRCYRNFNFEDYDATGSDLIIVAEKKGSLKSQISRRTTRHAAYRSRKLLGSVSNVLNMKVASRLEPRIPRKELSRSASSAPSKLQSSATLSQPAKEASPKAMETSLTNTRSLLEKVARKAGSQKTSRKAALSR